MSFDKCKTPGGDAKPSELSASKKLASAGSSALRSPSYTMENVINKASK